jgi:hypothetical protein
MKTKYIILVLFCLINYLGIAQDLILSSFNYKFGFSDNFETGDYSRNPSSVADINIDYLFDNKISFGVGLGTGNYITRTYTYGERDKNNPGGNFVYSKEDHRLLHHTFSVGFGFLLTKKIFKIPLIYHSKFYLQSMIFQSQTIKKTTIPEWESSRFYLNDAQQTEKREYNKYSLNTVFQQNILFKVYKNIGFNLGVEFCNATMFYPDVRNFQFRGVFGINHRFAVN